jgi:hypothetical protein
LQQPGVDPQVEQRFKQYLMDRASRSYPRFESLLDWLLAVYKFVFPFLVRAWELSRQQPAGSTHSDHTRQLRCSICTAIRHPCSALLFCSLLLWNSSSLC